MTMNHSAILAQYWEQCTTIIIFFHNFYALLSSTVFHYCIVALLSAVLNLVCELEHCLVEVGKQW